MAVLAYNGIMHVLTASEMRACDERTVEQYGISSHALMENAGSAVARLVAHQFPHAGRITVLCGKGNNGGDGLVAARHLYAAGRQVRLVQLAAAEDLQGEPRGAYDRLPELVQEGILTIRSEADLFSSAFDRCLAETDLFVDAIFGTGFHPPLRGVAAEISRRIAPHPAPVVSVDLPSGWDADATEISAADAFRSDAVVTFTAPKLAHAFGALTRGPVVVADIGSPRQAIVSGLNLTWTGTSKKIIEQPRAVDGNKGRFGHVLVVGGSPGKAGAPSMASIAALRAGAGLVTSAVPRGVAGIVAGFAPELMTLLLEESASGGISLQNLEASNLKMMLNGIKVLAVGPGMGRDPETAEFVRQFMHQTSLPVVLDADGLNAFEGESQKLHGNARDLVLTPHPGEMARLLGCQVAEVERDRLNIARSFATEHQVTLVLKGWRTLVAHPDGSVAVNTTGNPGMAKGGSGDILTGIVAAIIAQFPGQIKEAVECAVWLHGAAADQAVRAQDEHTLLATDTVRHLSDAMRMPVERDGFTWLQEGRR